ncbi:MAG: TRAP transporter large permease [Leucobacter sp.]|jgi:C4-dicarboxylate transporter DctM subunit|nr:TRAP transporter large permease [Leucobacter sp.]
MPFALFGVFGILLVVAVPVAVAMGAAAMISIWQAGIPMEIAAQRLISGISSFPLLAIPLFVFAGSLMNQGGITRRLIDFAFSVVGGVRGGLASVNVLTNMIFGGVSGSAVADAGAIGRIMIPDMVKRGYSRGYSAAVTATAATVALLLPPSIDLILYGVTAQVSIGLLFQWGLFAGLLLVGILLVTAYVTARRRGYPAERKSSWNDIWKSGVRALPALIIPIVVIGGVRFGVFTPTEGAGVAVLAAIFVGIFMYRGLTWRTFKASVVETTFLSIAIMSILAFAQVYSWALVTSGISRDIQAWAMSITDSRWLMLLIIVLVLMLIGTVLEGSAAILIFTPLFLPIMTGVGVDPLHFGIVVVAAMAFGLITPPVGITLLISTKIAGIPMHRSFKELLPWFIACMIALTAFAFIPLFFY